MLCMVRFFFNVLVEKWKNGEMEWWSGGVVEWWKNGRMEWSIWLTEDCLPVGSIAKAGLLLFYFLYHIHNIPSLFKSRRNYTLLNF